MTMPARQTAVRLSVFYASYFAGIGVMLPFWPVWLESRNLNAAEIGLVLAVGSAIKIVFNPLAANVADRRGTARPVIIALSLAAVAAYALFPLADGFVPILLVTLLFFSVWPAMMPLAETVTLQAARLRNLDYGRIRLWGSVTFVLTAIGVGRLLSSRPPDLIFAVILIAVAATAGAALLLPRVPASPGHAGRWLLVDVLRLPGFIVFLLAAALIQASHAVYYGFSTLHWLSAGLNAATVGALWAEGVIAEIILFIYGQRLLNRFGPAGLLVLAALAGLVRWPVLALSTDVPVLVAAQALHAFTFGAAHLGAIHYLSRTVPGGLAATAQSIYAAVVMGLALGLTLFAAGYLYESVRASSYGVMAVMAAASLGLALTLRRRQHTVPPEPRPLD